MNPGRNVGGRAGDACYPGYTLLTVGYTGWSSHTLIRPLLDPRFQAGDIVVAPAPDGGYQVARVPANGKSEHILACQTNREAALARACRATSGGQRVYVWDDAASVEYREFDCK